MNPDRYDRFTTREISVLRMILAGSNGKEIAKSFGVKEKTIRWYRTNIYKKTNTDSAHKLVALALKLRLDPYDSSQYKKLLNTERETNHKLLPGMI